MYNASNDPFTLGGHTFTSRFIIGSGKISMDFTPVVVENSGAQIVTLALRRANQAGGENILEYIPKGVTLLPNTSGARNADEAVRIARLSREIGCGDFIKIEVIRDSKYLLPDNAETIRATEQLAKEGFIVMPYMYPDLNVARDLQNAGAAAIMPPTRACAPRSLSRFWSTRSICPSSWTPASASPARHARPWKWAAPQSWPTPRSPPRVMLPVWHARSVRPLRLAVRLICPVWVVCSSAAARLPVRSPASCETKGGGNRR